MEINETCISTCLLEDKILKQFAILEKYKKITDRAYYSESEVKIVINIESNIGKLIKKLLELESKN